MTFRLALKQSVRAPYSRDSQLFHRIAATALCALLGELATWPKPGLVSHIDNGSHDDMDAAMLRKSAVTLRPFFAELAHIALRARRWFLFLPSYRTIIQS